MWQLKIGRIDAHYNIFIFLQEKELLLPFLYLKFRKGSIADTIIHTFTTKCIVTFFDVYLKEKFDIDFKKALDKNPEIEVQ